MRDGIEGKCVISETVTQNITLLSPEGKTAVIASRPDLVRPESSFISADGHLYLPITHPLKSAANSVANDTPFVVYAIALPVSFAGINLGDAVDGSGKI